MTFRENGVRLNTDSIKWNSTLYSIGNFTIRQYDDSTNWHSTTWRFAKTTIRWKWLRENDVAPNFLITYHKKTCESGIPYCFLTDFTKFFLWEHMLLDFSFLTDLFITYFIIYIIKFNIFQPMLVNAAMWIIAHIKIISKKILHSMHLVYPINYLR